MKRTLALALLLLVFVLLASKPVAERGEVVGFVTADKQLRGAGGAEIEVGAEDFRKSILRICPDAVLEGDPSGWLGQAKWGEGVSVGGREISAMTMNQIFLLGSRDFRLRWTGENFLFEINAVDKSYEEG